MLKKVLTQIMFCLGLVECWQSGWQGLCFAPGSEARTSLHLARHRVFILRGSENGFTVARRGTQNVSNLEGVILKAFSLFVRDRNRLWVCFPFSWHLLLFSLEKEKVVKKRENKPQLLNLVNYHFV